MSRPRLGFWQVWNMSFGFLGIQFGWGLQMANMSAIYQYLGADEGSIPILWLAAPLTGLVVQPIIGHLSDRTWSRLGRRRPYFLVGAVLASLALLAMPRSSSLWMAAGLLWILDASVNVSMEPFRAFVGDLLPSEQRKTGFAMQSLLIGAGAVLSSMLPYLLVNLFGVSGEATAESAIPPAVHVAFTVGAFVFFFAVLYTVLTTREHPPQDLRAFRRMQQESAGLRRAAAEIFAGIRSMPTAMRKLAWVQFFTWLAMFCLWIYFAPGVAKSIFNGVPLGVTDATADAALDTPAQAAALDAGAALARAYDALKADLARARPAQTDATSDRLLVLLGARPVPPDPAAQISPADLERLIRDHLDAVTIPLASPAERHSPMVRTIAQLLASPTSLSPPQGEAIAAAAERWSERLAAARRYQEGAAWAGVCFATYNLVAFAFAFVLLGLVKRASARAIHVACLAVGGASLLSVLAVGQPGPLLLAMAGVGIAWASILAMPYAMLANVLPPQKMGFYMGVFNFFIVLPQILASVVLGRVMEHLLDNDSMKAILLGGGSMLVASLLMLRLRTGETEHAQAEATSLGASASEGLAP